VAGSLFFRGILWIFDALGRFFGDSFVARMFTADFDESRLRDSAFVRLLEHAFNRFPKILAPPLDDGKNLMWLRGSALITFATEAMDTPLIRNLLRWFGAAFPAWGLLVVLLAAPFLPTMLLAGMLVVVLGTAVLRYRFTLDLTATFIMLYVLVMIFSAFTSLVPASSLPVAVLSSVLMLSYLLVRICFRSRRCVDFALFAFITAAAGTALFAVYQYVSGHLYVAWVDEDLFEHLRRAYSTFANPNVYGTFLLLVIPPAAAGVLYAKRLVFKLAALGTAGLLTLALGLTFSRGCYLAFAVSVAFFLLLIEKRLIVLFVAVLFAIPFVLPPAMLDRLVSVVNFEDSSTVFRIQIWQGSVRMLSDFWMSGVGQGVEAYNRAYPFYALSGTITPHSHNQFLQVFLEMGIVGLLVFLGILASFFRTQFSFIRNTADKRRRILSAAMTAAVVGFLFQGIFDLVFYNFRVMLAFFLFIGLANALTIAEGVAEGISDKSTTREPS